MLILALDTTGRYASAALCCDGAIIADCRRDSMMDHSRTLLPVCEDMLCEQGLMLRDIDLFAAVCGPGSYTGIRIGVAAVKGFAFGQDKPCIAVSSLEAAAWADQKALGNKLAIITARSGEVFAAHFLQQNGNLIRVSDDGVMDEQSLLALLQNEPLRLCGSAAAELLHAGKLPRDTAVAQQVQSARAAALCAFDKAQKGQSINYHALTPSYLRPTQAERMKQEKEGKLV